MHDIELRKVYLKYEDQPAYIVTPNGLTITVKVIDIKKSYGITRLKVTPVCDCCDGGIWVETVYLYNEKKPICNN